MDNKHKTAIKLGADLARIRGNAEAARTALRSLMALAYSSFLPAERKHLFNQTLAELEEIINSTGEKEAARMFERWLALEDNSTG